MSLVNEIRKKYGEILDTDSYKLSHSNVYDKNANWMMSYLESRGGQYQKVQFLGLQFILKEYFTNKLTHSQIDEMKEFSLAHCTVFPEKQFRKIVDVYGGYYPIIIKSVDEGTVLPTSNVLLTIESAVEDHDVMSVVSYLETKLMRLWYPTTVASMCYKIKSDMIPLLEKTVEGDYKDYIGFMVNDFGSRGTTDLVSSMLGGLGHLVNFIGSDNIPAVLAAKEGYGASTMPAYSIPATEHSIMTSKGKEGEEEIFLNYLDTYGQTNDLMACVADSYNIYDFCQKMLAKHKDRILNQKARLVVRPDSGDPLTMPIEVVEMLAEVFGYTVNSKGYKVLHDKVRVIQGDGVDETIAIEIMKKLIDKGWCVSNVCFGIGGSLLQKINRDTLKFAIKCSSMKYGDDYKDVFKAPITAAFKKSKAGRLVLLKTKDGYLTTTIEQWKLNYPEIEEQELKVRYDCGKIINTTTFEAIRAKSGL